MCLTDSDARLGAFLVPEFLPESGLNLFWPFLLKSPTYPALYLLNRHRGEADILIVWPRRRAAWTLFVIGSRGFRRVHLCELGSSGMNLSVLETCELRATSSTQRQANRSIVEFC
jgi:hypothetical protein